MIALALLGFKSSTVIRVEDPWLIFHSVRGKGMFYSSSRPNKAVLFVWREASILCLSPQIATSWHNMDECELVSRNNSGRRFGEAICCPRPPSSITRSRYWKILCKICGEGVVGGDKKHIVSLIAQLLEAVLEVFRKQWGKKQINWTNKKSTWLNSTLHELIENWFRQTPKFVTSTALFWSHTVIVSPNDLLSQLCYSATWIFPVILL